MFKKQRKGNPYLAGAIALGLASFATAMLFPRGRSLLKKMGDQSPRWNGIAKQLGERVSQHIQAWNPQQKKFSYSNFIWGTTLGSILGIATGIFLAPKVGNELLLDVSKRYRHPIKNLTKTASEIISSDHTRASTIPRRKKKATQHAR